MLWDQCNALSCHAAARYILTQKHLSKAFLHELSFSLYLSTKINDPPTVVVEGKNSAGKRECVNAATDVHRAQDLLLARAQHSTQRKIDTAATTSFSGIGGSGAAFWSSPCLFVSVSACASARSSLVCKINRKKRVRRWLLATGGRRGQ